MLDGVLGPTGVIFDLHRDASDQGRADGPLQIELPIGIARRSELFCLPFDGRGLSGEYEIKGTISVELLNKP